MQAANAMEVQRKIVVRTKSGSFTNPAPRTLWIIAEQSAAAACIANTHGGALLSKFRAMGLGLPLNSVLESKLNHDLLQQSRCQAGDANGCRLRIPSSCFRQIVFPQLKFVFIGKSRFDLRFLTSALASALEAMVRSARRIVRMTDNLAHIGPAMTTAFLASLVEAVEALTIVLAVATVRGWRPAGLGAFAGLLVLALIVVALGPLLDRVPLHLLQLAIGILLLLFGMRWLRKAILRSAGVIPLHDELTTFAAEPAELREQARRNEARLDWLAALASFKAVLLEGLEVVFIVIALSAGRGMLIPASAGAVAACLLVAGVGFVVHRPLARVPENTLKFAVGVMLSAFGLFWTGEGLGVAWPGADLAIVGFAVLFLIVGLASVAFLRRPRIKALS